MIIMIDFLFSQCQSLLVGVMFFGTLPVYIFCHT
jgi:hypothetical protein